MSLFSKNLKRIRKARGKTQHELAKLVKVSDSTITYYETGRSWPSRENITALAKALNVNEQEFFAADSRDVKTSNSEDLPVLSPEQIKKLISVSAAIQVLENSPKLTKKQLKNLVTPEIALEILKETKISPKKLKDLIPIEIAAAVIIQAVKKIGNH